MEGKGSFWLPTGASTLASDTDALWWFLVYLSLFFFLLISTGVIYFAVKYRRKKGDEEKVVIGPSHNPGLEALWIIIPSILVFIIFVWGFRGFLRQSVVPKDAMEIKVTGQKWFWSFDYPDGATTVNELVVPEDRPIKLLMSSQDVIHSFFVPAFRLKRDVLPNRYTITWFEATDPGDYDLFCAEYCGTKHSEMVGKIKVLPFSDYQKWIAEASVAGEGMTPEEYGAKLFVSKACATCHSADGTAGNGPTFQNLFGSMEKLTSGSSIEVDENYVRKSILEPASDVTAGFQPIMPTYQGLLKDREIDALVAYIKSLGESNEH